MIPQFGLNASYFLTENLKLQVGYTVIYWDRVIQGDGFRVHRSRLARVASDHLPVVARLQLPRRAEPESPASPD